MEQAVEQLQRSLDNGLLMITRRMDVIEERQTQRHEQNSERLDIANERLDQINGRVGKAHDRVSKTEALIGVINHELEKARHAIHEMAKDIQKRVFPCPQVGDAMTAENVRDLGKRPITFSEARTIILALVAALVAGATLTVWILKLTGKL